MLLNRERSPWARAWALDPEVIFLNHGSFGAAPRQVLEEQAELRRQLEAQPVDFFVRFLPGALDQARAGLAEFLGADPEGLGFVPNATTGVNAVLSSLRLEAGTEVLVTDHAYNACRNALDRRASEDGATVVVARLPFPIKDPSEVLEALGAAISERTRLALVDHITSPTGLVLPLEEMLALLAEHEVDVLVDGAHAPGMLPLGLESLAPAWYVGNCHKWICAPKGAGFLWARADKRGLTRPAIISHGANLPVDERSRFRQEFDWVGTDDPTAWLCVPRALEVMAALLPGGWPEVMQRNRELALEARRLLLSALGVAEPAPPTMVGSLAAVPLPEGDAGKPSALYSDPLQNRLWQRDRIEVPISPWPAAPQRLLRISAQLYNHRTDYEILASALKRELKVEVAARASRERER